MWANFGCRCARQFVGSCESPANTCCAPRMRTVTPNKMQHFGWLDMLSPYIAMGTSSPTEYRKVQSCSQKKLRAIIAANACVHKVQRKENHVGGRIGLEWMQLALCAKSTLDCVCGAGLQAGRGDTNTGCCRIMLVALWCLFHA